MKKHNDDNISINEARGRLFELIFDMPETKTRELLKELEKRGQDKHEKKEKRTHSRKQTFIQVDCLGQKCAFTDFIQNISAGGLYIETQMPLFVD
jgi:guanylate kinase